MSTLWIDGTLYFRSARPTVGITRVESVLIEWAKENIKELKFFGYDQYSGRFWEIDKDTQKPEPIRISYSENNQLNHLEKKGFFFKISFPEIRFYGKRLLKEINHLTRAVFSKSERNQFIIASHAVLKSAYALSLSLINNQYRSNLHHFFKKKYLVLSNLRSKKKVTVKSHVKHPFKAGDSILFAGTVWHYYNINENILKIKQNTKISVFTICHDLIPIKFPHFCLHEGGTGYEIFYPYFVSMTKIADHVFCVSKSTELDYKEFIKQNNLPSPTTSVVKEGSSIYTENLPPSPLIADLLKSEFILFVSTIERRKNHELIYKAILYLLENGYTKLPKFIFVGMKGWSVNELIMDIKLDPRVKGMITILHGLNDSDLKYLYQNCLFTLYPSFYEGWGLPIAESLLFGKFAIVSSTSSMPEVGGDFVDCIHPLDIIGWAKRIGFYLENRNELKEKEDKILREYQSPTWEKFCKQVFSSIP